MSDALPPADDNTPEHTGHGAWARGVVERHVALEEQLAEAALRLALAIEQGAAQAVAEGRPVDKDAALSFSRVAKAVRMSGLLQARLIKDMEQAQHRAEELQLAQAKQALAAWDKTCGEDEDLDPAQLEPADRHKYRVARIVARIAEAEHRDDEEEVERLMDEAAERLDDEDIYDDVLARPVGELVSLLCRDLDLKPDWNRLAEEAWARDEIESGVPSSPFNRTDSVRPPSFAAANGGGGPLAERSEERVVVGENHRTPPAETGAMWQSHAHADHYP